MQAFDYQMAFSRNIGWVTEAEQERLRTARVAVGGLGGVGGVHLLTLARMGIGRFTIVFAFGQIVGPGLVGALADWFGGLRPGFVLSAAALAAGALLATRQRARPP